MQRRLLRPVRRSQFQFHRQHDPAFGLALEDAVAIAEGAGLAVQPHHRAGLPVPGFHRQHRVADFNSVGTDVLDRRGADAAGDQGQVLQPAQALVQAPQHQLVPVGAGLGPHAHAWALFIKPGNRGRVQGQHRTGGIAGKQQVAATAEHQQRQVAQLRQVQRLRQGGVVVHLQQPGRTRQDSEGVAPAQVGVRLQAEGRAHARPAGAGGCMGRSFIRGWPCHRWAIPCAGASHRRTR